MIIFQNSGWIVTNGWMETTRKVGGEPEYLISMDMIMEVRPGDPGYYAWPLQVAEKEWADAPLFFEAFDRAIRYQAGRTRQPIDDVMLSRTYGLAIRLALLNQMAQVDGSRQTKRPGLVLISDFADSPAMILYEEREHALATIESAVSPK